MHKPIVFHYLAIAILLVAPVASNGAVDKQSIFSQAREPASRLDLVLHNIESWWWRSYIQNPSSQASQKRELVVRTKTSVDLSYFGGNTISATGWVAKTSEFLSLSKEDRKQLLHNVLQSIFSSLQGDVYIRPHSEKNSPKTLKRHHIELSLIISNVVNNAHGENIRLTLPTGIGVGHAGYKDGQFVYSNPYYLNLEITPEGKAKPGDPEQFTIEKE
jgi:hypothetical protein